MIIKKTYKKIINHFSNDQRNYPFDYKTYWEKRYRSGGNSGLGSTGVLAEYKSNVINEFVNKNQIRDVVEFGCGDGYQLSLSQYSKYLGLDVAPSSIELCQNIFAGDKAKSFILYNPKYFTNHNAIMADLVLCLDTLYHITDDNDYYKTLDDIFSSSRRFVILYTNTIPLQSNTKHIIYRDTLNDLNRYQEFSVDRVEKAEHPDLTIAQFIFLEKLHEQFK